MSVWSFVVDLVVTIAAIFQILDYWGIRPRSGDGGVPMPLSRKWKLAIMLGLMVVSLGLSGYGFYRSLRPKIVEKTVTIEKPVDKIVEKIVPAQCPSPQKFDKVKSTKPTALTTPVPPVKQDCGGGNCAVSVGQQGGVTAGQVTLGAKTWDMAMTGEKQKAMIPTLQAVHGSIRVEWLTFDPDSLKASGGILYTFVHAGWTKNDRPNAAGNMCIPSQEWDCHGLRVSVRDRNSDLAKTALQALSMLQEPIQVTELPKDLPDDLVVVFAAKP